MGFAWALTQDLLIYLFVGDLTSDKRGCLLFKDRDSCDSSDEDLGSRLGLAPGSARCQPELCNYAAGVGIRPRRAIGAQLPVELPEWLLSCSSFLYGFKPH
jgi:hypothetical protein